MSAFGLVSRSFTAVSILAVLSACSTTTPKDGQDVASPAAQTQAAVIQGGCPQIYLRDGTAFHDVYAGAAKTLPDGSTDQANLLYRATMAETTRQCRQTPDGLVMTVQAAGRLIKGPAGSAKTGSVKLPIRVVVTDEATVLYSELTQFDVTLPANEPATQFFFTKADVLIPGGSGTLAKAYIGFDNGPAPKANKKKK
jgi:hypothetical protein